MSTPALLPRLLIAALLVLHGSGCQSASTASVAATAPALTAPAPASTLGTGNAVSGQAYAMPATSLNGDAAQAIDTSAALGPARIAVLLPLHGKLAAAGTALQRGMLATWYEEQEKGITQPALEFHDSSRSDFLATYDAAVAAGAQLVIGPLEKENLRLLQQRGKLPVPTLALNYADNEADAVPANLYFIGLAGEDEAAQVASSLASQKLMRAAVLFPAADWGQRIARAFEETLQAQGGRVQARGSYQGNGDYNDVVRRLMDVGTSELRHDRIQRLLGVPLAFQPTRRQDIDALFIVANTPQATQIVPAVQYHYGGNIPTVSTSHINSQTDSNAAGDLNGIRFVEMPWIVDASHPMRVRVTRAWDDVDARVLRLYALGVDALRASRQLGALAGGRGYKLEGASGELTMDARHALHRQLTWMVFRDGRAEPVDANTDASTAAAP